MAGLKDKENTQSDESFTIRTFYGKREKTYYPHSPRRRRAVNKVLEKISDDSTESDEEVLKRKIKPGKLSGGKDVFEMRSSSSGEDGNNPKVWHLKKSDTKQSVAKSAAKKVPLKIQHGMTTPKANRTSARQLQCYSASKLQVKTEVLQDEKVKQPSSEKKFFKTRSPGDNALRSTVLLKKGFGMKFVPKRSLGTPGKNVKDQQHKKAGSSKTKLVERIKAADDKPFKNVGVEMSLVNDDSEVKTDDKQISVRNEEDSGVDIGNSHELFSSCSEETSHNVVKGNVDNCSISLKQPVDVNLLPVTPASPKISGSDPGSPSSDSEIMSLISEVSSTECSTPKSYPIFDSKPCTPSATSQIGKLR